MPYMKMVGSPKVNLGLSSMKLLLEFENTVYHQLYTFFYNLRITYNSTHHPSLSKKPSVAPKCLEIGESRQYSLPYLSTIPRQTCHSIGSLYRHLSTS